MKRKTLLQKAMLDAPQLAKMAGLNVETVRAIMYGKRRGLASTRRKIADALRRHSADLSVLADQLEAPTD